MSRVTSQIWYSVQPNFHQKNFETGFLKSDSTFESEVMGPHETIIVNASWTSSGWAFD